MCNIVFRKTMVARKETFVGEFSQNPSRERFPRLGSGPCQGGVINFVIFVTLSGRFGWEMGRGMLTSSVENEMSASLSGVDHVATCISDSPSEIDPT